MKHSFQTIQTKEECLKVLKDPDYVVPDYGHFFQTLSSHSGVSFDTLTAIFTSNLFALSGKSHQVQKQRLMPCLSKDSIDLAEEGLRRIIGEELDRIEPGIQDLLPFTDRVSYRCVYHYLGIREEYHEAYLSGLEALRQVVDNRTPKKIGDYIAIEKQVSSLFSILKPQLSSEQKGIMGTLRSNFPDDEEICATIVVLLAGSGAMASTLANMIHFIASSPLERRDYFVNHTNPTQMIDKLLYRCGGTKFTYRHHCKTPNEMILLDLDHASKEAVSVDQIFSDYRPNRSSNLSFGAGEHRCIGEMLSRKIIEWTITSFCKKFPTTLPADEDSREFFLFSPRNNLMCRVL